MLKPVSQPLASHELPAAQLRPSCCPEHRSPRRRASTRRRPAMASMLKWSCQPPAPRGQHIWHSKNICRRRRKHWSVWLFDEGADNLWMWPSCVRTELDYQKEYGSLCPWQPARNQKQNVLRKMEAKKLAEDDRKYDESSRYVTIEIRTWFAVPEDAWKPPSCSIVCDL